MNNGKGKFTPLYPELGTGPVSYEDSISSEAFEYLYALMSDISLGPGTRTRDAVPRLSAQTRTRGLPESVPGRQNLKARLIRIPEQHPGFRTRDWQ